MSSRDEKRREEEEEEEELAYDGKNNGILFYSHFIKYFMELIEFSLIEGNSFL